MKETLLNISSSYIVDANHIPEVLNETQLLRGINSTTYALNDFSGGGNTYHEYQNEKINLSYAIFEILVAITAVIGNALVIIVFKRERRLRRRTNYYIVSLAIADLLVGLLGIPFAILSSIGIPTDNLYACLFTVSLLLVLCTISIFCLVAVSIDRYWAILYPMGYSRNVRTRTTIVIISICWMAGSFVGLLPLMGWYRTQTYDGRCFFLQVMDYNYLVFLYFGTIITPALLLAAFYVHIYRVVVKQLRQIVTMNPSNVGTVCAANEPTAATTNNVAGSGGSGTMLRMLGAVQKREVKATQNLSIIVLFFMICWIPLYTINCVLAFCNDCEINSTFMLSCIILSHLNSAGNPLLYAYHLKDFRAALKHILCRLIMCQVSGDKDEEGVTTFRQQQQHSQKNYPSTYKYRYRFKNPQMVKDYSEMRKHQELLKPPSKYNPAIYVSQHRTPSDANKIITLKSVVSCVDEQFRNVRNEVHTEDVIEPEPV